MSKNYFYGYTIFAVPILKSLYQNGYPISVVYTQPPKKSKRGQKINKSPIQGLSETLNINFRSPITLKNNQEEYEFLKNESRSLNYSCLWSNNSKEFLNLTKKGLLIFMALYFLSGEVRLKFHVL